MRSHFYYGDSVNQVSLDDGFHRIGSDPFWLPVDAKDPVRRLRGQLPAPVTVWTAASPDGSPVGITVSSVLIAEGDTATVIGLIAPLSDFWDAVQITRRFLVHVLSADQVRVADQFALRYPGDPFEGLATSNSEHGPILDGSATWAKCCLDSHMEVGWSVLAKGLIVDIMAAANPRLPLVNYRGRYLSVGPRKNPPDG